MKNICIKTKLLCFVCMAVVFTQCVRTSDGIEPESSYFFDLNRRESITELFDHIESAETVPLETTDECLIGTIDKILAWEDRYYILDGKFRRILCFDTEGRFLSKLDKVGRGPGEYMYIRDFDIRDERLYVLEIDKIMVYDLSGEFQKSIPVDYGGGLNAFSVLGDDRYAIASVSQEDDFLLHIVDGTGKVTKSMLECPKSLRMTLDVYSNGWSFQRSEGRLYLSLPVLASVIALDEDENPVPVFSFESDRNPEKYIKKNVLTEKNFNRFCETLESKYLLAERKTVTPVFYAFESDMGGKNLLLFYDRVKRTGKVFSGEKSIVAFFLFGDNCFPVSDKVLVSDFSPLGGEEVLSQISRYSKVPFEKDLVEKLKAHASDQNNPVLVRYTLK